MTKLNNALLHPYIVLIYLALLIVPLIVIAKEGNENSDRDIKKYTSDLPFELPVVSLPQFPNRIFNIKDFGAVGDGHTVNTDAIASAIHACAEAGGGRVVVPAGIWYTGPIIHHSNVNLHVEKRAIILFSGNFEDYSIIQTSWNGLPLVRCISPIYGKNLENIALTGEGIFDGSGDSWRPARKDELTERHWNELLKSGGAVKEEGSLLLWYPSKEASQGKELVKELDKRKNVSLEEYAAAREYLRPVLVSLANCKKVLLDGPTFQNSPSWNIHPLLCENMVIRNVNVRNPWYSVNGDGIDLESCRNVVMYNCCFDVGDDAICLKSGRNEYGRQRRIPSENIVIADCIVYRGHGGFTIGSEMSGGIRNISIQDCVFMGTDVILRFKSTRGRGGVVENIYVNNILMEDIYTDAIRFNMFYQNREATFEDKFVDVSQQVIPPVTEETPLFQQIFMNEITCRNANRAVFLQGLPEIAIQNIELNNALISTKYGVACVDAENIKMKNVTIMTKSGPVFSFSNSRNIEIENADFPAIVKTVIELSGTKTDEIHLTGIDLHRMKDRIKISKGVKADAVRFH